MADQDKDKSKTKLQVSYDDLFSAPPKGAGGVSYDELFPTKSPEEQAKEEEWQKKKPLQKFGTGAKVGIIGMGAGIKSTLAEIMPLMSKIPAGFPGGGLVTFENGFVASQVFKQEARKTLEKRNEIYGHGTMFELGTMTPLLAGIVASGGAGLAGAGVAATLIGEGTMVAMTADIYGNSILEQELYQEKTGKEIPEFQKQAVALSSAVAMLIAGKIIGSGVKGVNKLIGESISSSLIESPEVATNLFRRYLADQPTAIRKISNLALGVGKETAKSGATMGIMTAAQDFLANINKYPEDRLSLEEIVTNTMQSVKMGGMLGLILGPFAAGQSELYHQMRRKKSGINLVQTSDGQVYERISDHPTDPNKVTVMDKNMKFKDIQREDITDWTSMTMTEKEQLLDAYKTHQEAMPGIEEAIKRNAVKRKTNEIAEALIFEDLPGRKPGINTAAKGQAFVRMYDVQGEKLFVKTISQDGKLAEVWKVVPKGDGSFGFQKSMVKNIDLSKITDVPVSDFSQMAFEFYTTAEAPKPGINKDGSPVDPIARQKAQDIANKTAKAGDEIQYMGRTWEVQEITFDGTVKVNEIKEDGEYGEAIDIPSDKLADINKDIEEPVVEMVSVDGVKQAAHQGPPVYEKDGRPQSKGYIRGAIRMAKTPQDLYGLRWENDPELDKMYKAKFPEMIQTYKIEGEEVERDEVEGAISHASDPADLLNIEINLDPETQGLLDAKLATLYEPIGKSVGAEYFGITKGGKNERLINFNVPVEGMPEPASISMKSGFTPEELVKKVEAKKKEFEKPVEKKPTESVGKVSETIGEETEKTIKEPVKESEKKPTGKELVPVEQMFDKKVSEVNSEWDDHYMDVDEQIKKLAEQSKPLKEELKKLTPKKDKISAARKKELKTQIEDLDIMQPSNLKRQLDAKFIDRWEKLREVAIAKAKERGIEIDPEDAGTVIDDFLMDITERPGIEHTWNQTVGEVFDNLIKQKPEVPAEKPIQPTGPKEGPGKENIVLGGIQRMPAGTPEEGKGQFTGIHKIVNERFRTALEGDYERYKAEYLGKFGNTISGDLAKSLSPDYRNNPIEFSQSVHDPASDFAKKLYDDLIQGEPAGEENNFVIMTAGGTGAGKTTALNFKLEKENPPYLIYDSNMANFETSKGRIEKALDNGKEVDILYVWRDPFDAYVHGVVPRMKEERRPIGIGVHIKTTVKSLGNVRELYDLYKDNENVTFTFFDNDIQEEVQPEAVFGKIPIDEVELKRRLQDEIQSLHNQGGLTQEETRILSEETHAGDEQEIQRTGSTEEVTGQPTFPAEETISVSKPEFAGETIKPKVLRKGAKRKIMFSPGSRTGKALDKTPNDFTESTLQFFVGGGRINIDDFINHTNFQRNGKKFKKYFQLLATKGVKLDVFHESLENSFGMENKGAMDMINEIIDLMKRFPNRGLMLTELMRRQGEPIQEVPTEEEMLNDIESKTIEDVVEINKDAEEDFWQIAGEDQETLAIFTHGEFLKEGQIDWEGLKNKIETEPEFFMQSTFGLTEEEFQKLKTLFNDTEQQKRFEADIQSSILPDGLGEGDNLRQGTDQGKEGTAEEIGENTGGGRTPAREITSPEVNKKPEFAGEILKPPAEPVIHLDSKGNEIKIGDWLIYGRDPRETGFPIEPLLAHIQKVKGFRENAGVIYPIFEEGKAGNYPVDAYTNVPDPETLRKEAEEKKNLTPEEKKDEPPIEREVEELDDPEDDVPLDKPMTDKEARQEKLEFDEADQLIEKVGPIKDFGEKIGGARKDEAESGYTMRSREKKEKVLAWMSGFKILTELDKYRPIKAHGQFIIWKSKELFDSQEEALQRIKLVVITSKFKIGKVGDKEDMTFHVYRRVTDRKRYSLKGGFETEQDAMKWMLEHQEYLLNYKPSFPIRPHIEKLERTGKPTRQGSVTTQQFRDRFGFSGGEFGNWVPQDERQRILDMAWDGLSDLAEVLVVPPKALSLNGQLSIAFGARGQGLKGASAHYEPARAVFNLTRMKGAGGVAHEWFHALDHYLGRSAEELTSEKESGKPFEKRGLFLSDTVSYRMKGTRAELKEAFNNLLEGIFKQPKIIEVSLEHYAKQITRWNDNLDYELKQARGWIVRGREYGNRKKPGATDTQLQKWDNLVEKIKVGDYGAVVEYETKEKGWKGAKVTRKTYQNIIVLDEIAKSVLGRSLLTKDNYLTKVGNYLGFIKSGQVQLEKYKIDNKEERSTPTRFFYDAKDLDNLRVSDYWQTNPEMLARAFEAFVEDQINKKGDVSQYLVHSTDNENYKDPLFGDQRPYPEGEERIKFNELFQTFFDNLKTTEHGENIALYKRTPIWDNYDYPKYKPIPGAFAGDQVNVMFEHELMRRAQIMSEYTGVPVIVVKTKNDLPQHIVKHAIKQFGDLSQSSIPSVYDRANKKVYVVTEDTKSVSDEVSNMSHEIFSHHGLPVLLGTEPYLDVLQLVYRGMSPVDIANKATEYKTSTEDWKTIAEEYIGDMGGNNQINPTLWQRVIAKIREWIRKLFNISMSKAEIITLLNKSKRNLIKNRPNKEEFLNKPAGEYLDAMVAWSAKPGTAESRIGGYGIRVSESRAIEEAIAKGNQDYQTYFGVARSVIGDKSAGWIEKSLKENNFDYNKSLDYLESKMEKHYPDKLYDIIKIGRKYLSENEPKDPEGLYKVLIGKGKSPQELDFLTWDKPVDFDHQENIINQLDVEGKYDITLSGTFHSGESLYNKIVSLYGSDREASLFLSRAGIDGMIHSETQQGLAETTIEKNKGFVIYDNTPVERLNEIAYKRSQKTTFIGEHLANAGKVYADKAITKRNWEETVQGIREYIQDQNLPVRKFEEEIIKRGGLQPNDAKPYRDASLSFGRQEVLYKDFTKTKMRPINETVTKIIKSGMPGENILPYVISKHAIERNMVFRARELDEFVNRPSPNDPTQQEIDEFREAIADKDYSGVMAFDVNNEFVNPDELARTITDEFEAIVPKSLTDELWNNIRKASTATLDYWEAGQQLSPEQKQEYLDQFKYFVPLRGWRDGAAKDLVYVKGEGFKKSLMHAEGRKSLADNPLAYMQSVAFSAIGEQVDNEVKTSMLKLLMRNLQSADLYDLATVKKLYYVKVNLPDGSFEWEPTLDRPDQKLFDSGDAVTKIYNEYQKLRIPKQAREHEVVVRRQGGDVVMVFKGKMLPVAQAMNKRNFMYHNIFGKVKDARIMNQAVTGLSYMNNFLKAAYTSWNIVFPFTNFMRDFQEASITQLIKGDAGHKVIANYHRAFPSIIRFLREKLDMNNPDDVKLRDFYLVGGATGFTHLLSAEDLEKDLMSEINRMVGRGTVRGEIKNAMHETVQVVSMWNQVFEDATRFSVYLTSIDLGKTKEEAASDAKEASVNFNRKGKSSKQYDAIYAFWNVAWQSLQKNFKLGKDYPKRFVAVASAFMALGFLEALLNKSTDDEDPENDYYNINPYMRENYLILPNLPRVISGESKGNKYLSIPLPQFWRGFKSIGSLAFDLTQGKVTVKEAITKAILNFGSAMSPIDIGGFGKTGEFSIAPIIPTVAKPFYELATNRNYMGYTIAREPFDKSQEKLLANARLGKDNVNPAAKFLTDMLFRWGGGDNATKYYMSKTGEEKKVPFFLDINPSFVEHLFKGYTGGSGMVFSDLITTISQALTPDQEISFKNIPFVNKFLRETPESKWNIIADYYNLKDVVSVHKGLKRDYQKQAEAGGSTAGIEATEGSSYYQQYQDILDSYDKDIKEISDQVDFADEKGTEPIYQLMSECIKAINDLKKEYKK